MTKEEKIKEAYIEVFGEKRIRSIMNYVYKENGFIEGFVLLDLKLDIKNEKLERKFNGVVYSYRPKSLQGIENNNGWIKIESEKDLPKEKGLKCLFLNKNNMHATYISDDVLYDSDWFFRRYTHWKIKNEFKYPLY